MHIHQKWGRIFPGLGQQPGTNPRQYSSKKQSGRKLQGPTKASEMGTDPGKGNIMRK